MQEIRWGIIGVGDVCEVKSAPAMNKIEGSKLIAVMRRNSEKAADYARRHGVPKWYADADALLNDPEINAIYIATPPNSHAEYTRKAAAAGKPVYVEKPMARTFAECQAMIRHCREAAVPLRAAYYRRCLPNFLKVKDLVENGAIGEVRMVKMELFQSAKPEIVRGLDRNWRVQPEIAGGGYFFDLASHQFDYLDYVFGPIANARGIAANQAGLYPAEDVVSAAYQFESGVMGSGSWCFTVGKPADIEMTTILGSKGQIRFHFFTGSKVYLERGSEREVFDFRMPEHIQQPLIQTIVDEWLGKADASPSTGESAARTNWVMEQVIKE